MPAFATDYKINWYRCPIDKALLGELMQRNDLRGWLQTLAHLGLFFATGALAYIRIPQHRCRQLAVVGPTTPRRALRSRHDRAVHGPDRHPRTAAPHGLQEPRLERLLREVLRILKLVGLHLVPGEPRHPPSGHVPCRLRWRGAAADPLQPAPMARLARPLGLGSGQHLAAVEVSVAPRQRGGSSAIGTTTCCRSRTPRYGDDIATGHGRC